MLSSKPRAFSSEVDTGSREENALFQNQTRLSNPSGSENALPCPEKRGKGLGKQINPASGFG
jgi:hypothetical protein